MEKTLTDLQPYEMVAHASPMAKAVLLILLVFSVVSWAIVINKFISFHLARREDQRFLSFFGENLDWAEVKKLCGGLRFSPVARVFTTGIEELDYFRDTASREKKRNGTPAPSAKEGADAKFLMLEDLKGIAISMDDTINKEVEQLRSWLNFLATTGSATPFIGLFGTVWGIMYSFHAIGVKGSASIANVAPGIAEALIATAAGLFVAIPAVIFYNFLNSKIQWFTNRMENFLHNFICQTEKRFLYKRVLSQSERVMLGEGKE